MRLCLSGRFHRRDAPALPLLGDRTITGNEYGPLNNNLALPSITKASTSAVRTWLHMPHQHPKRRPPSRRVRRLKERKKYIAAIGPNCWGVCFETIRALSAGLGKEIEGKQAGLTYSDPHECSHPSSLQGGPPSCVIAGDSANASFVLPPNILFFEDCMSCT